MKKPSKLKILRNNADLTQEELAERANTSQQKIQQLESGKRRLTVDWVVLLADALGVHPSELLPDNAADTKEKGALTQPPTKAGVLRESLNLSLATARLEYIDKLNDMLKRRIITQAEYNAQKKKHLKG
jgi:transcriptional regulator with XRE-family HTH domain